VNDNRVTQAATAAASASRAEETARPTVTLSNGIVLALKPVPAMVIRAAVNRIPEPKVPKVYIQDKDREEENPDDPDYQRALAQHTEDTSMAAFEAVLLLGTSVVSVPANMERPEGNEWLSKLVTLGIGPDGDNPDERYLAWLQYYALTTARDIAALTAAGRDLAGVREEAVAQAVTSFPGEAARGADNGSTGAEPS